MFKLYPDSSGDMAAWSGGIGGSKSSIAFFIFSNGVAIITKKQSGRHKVFTLYAD